MAVTAAVVAGAVTAAAGIASTALSATSGSGGSKSPRFIQTPEPAYEKALREYTARLLAQGASTVPPSFLDFVASGGKATFDLGNTALTPGEAVGLRQVGPGGASIPFVGPGGTSVPGPKLTQDQIMYLASLQKGALGTGGRTIKKLRELESGRDTPKREDKLRQQLKKRTGYDF